MREIKFQVNNESVPLVSEVSELVKPPCACGNTPKALAPGLQTGSWPKGIVLAECGLKTGGLKRNPSLAGARVGGQGGPITHDLQHAPTRPRRTTSHVFTPLIRRVLLSLRKFSFFRL